MNDNVDWDTVRWHIGITRRFPWIPDLWWTAQDKTPEADPHIHAPSSDFTAVGQALLAAADAQDARAVVNGSRSR